MTEGTSDTQHSGVRDAKHLVRSEGISSMESNLERRVLWALNWNLLDILREVSINLRTYFKYLWLLDGISFHSTLGRIRILTLSDYIHLLPTGYALFGYSEHLPPSQLPHLPAAYRASWRTSPSCGERWQRGCVESRGKLPSSLGGWPALSASAKNQEGEHNPPGLSLWRRKHQQNWHQILQQQTNPFHLKSTRIARKPKVTSLPSRLISTT